VPKRRYKARAYTTKGQFSPWAYITEPSLQCGGYDTPSKAGISLLWMAKGRGSIQSKDLEQHGIDAKQQGQLSKLRT